MEVETELFHLSQQSPYTKGPQAEAAQNIAEFSGENRSRKAQLQGDEMGKQLGVVAGALGYRQAGRQMETIEVNDHSVQVLPKNSKPFLPEFPIQGQIKPRLA